MDRAEKLKKRREMAARLFKLEPRRMLFNRAWWSIVFLGPPKERKSNDPS